MGISWFFKRQLPQLWSYVPSQWNQSSAWKPAIRSALTSWICLVILLIEPAARALGNAPFFILMVSFMIPPALPFLASMELIFTTLILAHSAWAWCVIGAAIASAVRDPPSADRVDSYRQAYMDSSYSQSQIDQRIMFDGVYLSARSSVVFGVFLGTGIATLAWIRITNPAKYALPTILSSILIIVSCSYGALIPGFQQEALLGTYFALPLLTYSAVAIIISCFVFPESVQHKYLGGVSQTLDGIGMIVEQQHPMLCTPPSSDDFSKFKKTGDIRAAAALKYQGTLLLKPSLTREFSYSRWSGRDCKEIDEKVRRLLLRAGGLQNFYDLIGTWQDRYRKAAQRKEENEKCERALDEDDDTDEDDADTHHDDQEHDLSRFNTAATRSTASSHPTRSRDSVTQTRDGSSSPNKKTSQTHVGHPIDLLRQTLNHNHQHHKPASKIKPVGVWETLTRANLEGRLLSKKDREWLNDITPRLGPASKRLLEACETSIASSSFCIRQVNKQRIWTSLGIHFDTSALPATLQPSKKSKAKDASLPSVLEAHKELKSALEDFRANKRHDVIQPYRAYFDQLTEFQKNEDTELSLEDIAGPPPHRALFYSLLYEFQLIEFAAATSELSACLLQLQKKEEIRLHKPRFRKVLDLFRSGTADEGYDEEAPDDIKGLVSGDIATRDPDAKEPTNIIHHLVRAVSKFISSATRGNLFFAIRAGVLIVLVTLPQYMDSTAAFYYYNRGLWVSIMAVFTFQRWAGDTSLQFLFRTVGTFVGVVIGCALWYIGSGGENGNPFGLATICGVTWPFIFLYRVSAPPPVLVAVIIMTVSIGLVVGYSIVDWYGGFSLSSPGVGWTVTWRRFLLVMIGLTASYLASYLPQPESARQKVRLTLAQSLDSLAEVYTELVSFAARSHHSRPDMRIVRNLITINNKLRISVGQRMNAAPLELKSGPWPQATYQALQKTLLEISDLLGQLMVVYLRSEKDEDFRRGLLLRTRFLDPSFIGEVTSTLWMVAQALRHGRAMPHVTIAPLESRLNSTNMGLIVPKAKFKEVFHHPTAAAITGDAVRDAMLNNIKRGRGRRRQKWSEGPSTTDGYTSPEADQSLAKSRMQADLLDAATPGAQTPLANGDMNDYFQSRSPAGGTGAASNPISPVATRQSAQGTYLSAPETPHFPVRSHAQLSLEDVLSFETLQDENYMVFSAGVSLSFSLIRRIDALVLLVKELVGESYRVHHLPKDAVDGRYTLHV